MERLKKCPYCGKEIVSTACQCKYCGQRFNMANTQTKTKSRALAAVLAFFLGGLGIHKFYMGKVRWGIAYLLFCWTGIPTIVSFVEAILYIFSDDTTFNNTYCK